MADPSTAGSMRAQPHAVFQKFLHEVRKGFMQKEVTIQGTTFVLVTPNEDDVIWADGFIRPTTPLSYASSRRAPRLAASIRQIDGVKLADMFQPPENTKPEDLERLKDPDAKRYWLQSQLMLFLVEDVPPPVLEKLYEAYQALLDDREKALAMVAHNPNSLTRTPGSAAEPT